MEILGKLANKFSIDNYIDNFSSMLIRSEQVRTTQTQKYKSVCPEVLFEHEHKRYSLQKTSVFI